MPSKPLRFCKHTGCNVLTSDKYCDAHKADEAELIAQQDKRRGTARERGYTYRWSKYSKWFLSQQGNQLCKLHLDNNCAIIAQCVDHIVAHHGQSDPLFWDRTNHQAACIHCNSVKGNKTIKGEYEL